MAGSKVLKPSVFQQGPQCRQKGMWHHLTRWRGSICMTIPTYHIQDDLTGMTSLASKASDAENVQTHCSPHASHELAQMHLTPFSCFV